MTTAKRVVFVARDARNFAVDNLDVEAAHGFAKVAGSKMGSGHDVKDFRNVQATSVA